jgi:hypothetical protein
LFFAQNYACKLPRLLDRMGDPSLFSFFVPVLELNR